LLNAVGLKVQRTIDDTAGLIAGVITEKNYDLACWGINFTAADIWFSLSTYASDSPTNYTGLKDAQMDQALAQLRAAANNDEIRDALAAVQRRWNEVVPSAVYGALETYAAYSGRVHGLVQTVRETFLFHDAYLDK
jgi:ABC-type transport system substrate-binding protein